MNDTEITQLVAIRNQITDRETALNAAYTPHSVDMIDCLLRTVPQGEREDVDKLLGRYAAIVEAIEYHAKREGYYRNQSVIVPESQAVAERMVAEYKTSQDVDIKAMLEQHNTRATERRERMGEDYWDRKSKQPPIMSAAPNGNYASGCGIGGND